MMNMSSFFFFNDTATTEIYTLSLHDALPIWRADAVREGAGQWQQDSLPRRVRGHEVQPSPAAPPQGDRKSTRLNSSHDQISYAVFCLKKKKKETCHDQHTTTVQPVSCGSSCT